LGDKNVNNLARVHTRNAEFSDIDFIYPGFKKKAGAYECVGKNMKRGMKITYMNHNFQMNPSFAWVFSGGKVMSKNQSKYGYVSSAFPWSSFFTVFPGLSLVFSIPGLVVVGISQQWVSANLLIITVLFGIPVIASAVISYRIACSNVKELDLSGVRLDDYEVITTASANRPRSERMIQKLPRKQTEQMRLDRVRRLELNKLVDRGLSAHYTITLVGDGAYTTVPLTHEAVRSRFLLPDSEVRRPVGRGRSDHYPGQRFVDDLRDRLRDTPLNVTATYIGKSGVKEDRYEFRDPTNPWRKDCRMDTSSPRVLSRRQIVIAILIGIMLVCIPCVLYTLKYRQKSEEMLRALDVAKERAMQKVAK
jgi:hypothetical protein